jgi:hypothetical protein
VEASNHELTLTSELTRSAFVYPKITGSYISASALADQAKFLSIGTLSSPI